MGRSVGRSVKRSCLTCKKTFYVCPSQVKLGKGKFCSKRCQGSAFTGNGNPFFGRSHTAEARSRISESRKGKCRGNQNGKGYRHLDSARKRIAEASRKMWAEQREKMIASLPRGPKHHFHKDPELRRYRENFTPRQRREWIAAKCFYCKTTKDLELDHIIPVFDGGTRCRSNTQTLCRGCNLWKTFHVDLPRRNASLGR